VKFDETVKRRFKIQRRYNGFYEEYYSVPPVAQTLITTMSHKTGELAIVHGMYLLVLKWDGGNCTMFQSVLRCKDGAVR